MSLHQKKLAERKGFAVGPTSKSPLGLCMMAETHLTFFSIQTHMLKQKGGIGMGYIQAKK